ncbi:MAG TPA: ABC transporter substrate-binding protein [Candidatus Dormibacteraeota bacterium]|nr:ABC transporter substrate-binding protein [Candidatus Dormibacteraeota bacterium]
MANLYGRLGLKALALGLGTVFLVACQGSSSSSGSPQGSTEVTVWTAWGGNELTAFQNVLKPFEQKTGIKVHVTTNRDSTTQIANGIAAGTDLPDIAPATTDPIQLKDWVSKGVIKPVETALGSGFDTYVSNTYPGLVKPPSGSTGDDPFIGIIGGKHYYLMIKYQIKGLFWYNKKVFTDPAPKTWTDLLAIDPTKYGAQKLFCAGVESGAASGWPASDDLDNIIMRQSGPDVYTKWINGQQKWTSTEIKQGYQALLQMTSGNNVYGGPNYVLSTNFAKAGDPLFKPAGNFKAGCLFLEQATFQPSFFTQSFPDLKAGTDFDFFGHPSMGNSANDGNYNGFYDNYAMYNDTPAARQLMAWMVDPQAQQIWASSGVSLSSNKNTTYTDPVFKNAATVAASGTNMLITAGDYMPTDMRNAYWKSLLDATNNPSNLDSILKHLDQVQSAAYQAS